MKQADALIRVSTERQLEGTSPEKQLEKIHELAKIQGYSIGMEHTWKIAESLVLAGEDTSEKTASVKFTSAPALVCTAAPPQGAPG